MPASTSHQSNFSERNLFNSGWHQWLIHLVVALSLLTFILAIPISWEQLTVPQSDEFISIELTSPNQASQENLLPQQETITNQPSEPINTETETQTAPPQTVEEAKTNPAENKAQENSKTETAQTQAEEVISSNAPTQQQVTTPKVSSGIIFNSMQNINTDTRIGEEFDLPTAQSDYIEKQWESENLNTETPFLDESIDKPRVEMNFYAAGIEGSVERFFDKITYKKQFTTKYGTKIYCANVAFLVMCSWK